MRWAQKKEGSGGPTPKLQQTTKQSLRQRYLFVVLPHPSMQLAGFGHREVLGEFAVLLGKQALIKRHLAQDVLAIL